MHTTTEDSTRRSPPIRILLRDRLAVLLRGALISIDTRRQGFNKRELNQEFVPHRCETLMSQSLLYPKSSSSCSSIATRQMFFNCSETNGAIIRNG